jgi:hypothetical protein
MAITLVIIVDVSSGRMPNSPACGCHFVFVRNSSRLTLPSVKKWSDSLPRTTTIPMVVKIEAMPQR